MVKSTKKPKANHIGVANQAFPAYTVADHHFHEMSKEKTTHPASRVQGEEQ
jgi:hypothetical protein